MIWNFCIRRPVLTIVVFIVLAIFGVFGFMQMPVQENPDVEFPVVSVSVVLPGAAPEVIESEIIEPLEGEINTVEGLKQLTSQAREQSASITAEFELWRDIDIAAQDVRDAVERARRHLPLDAEAPMVRKIDPGAQAIMWVSLTGDDRWDVIRLTNYAEDNLRQRLETVRGVGQVMLGGRQRYAVRIRLDAELLAAHHLTVTDVVQAIQVNNVDIPSGRIEGAQREFLVKTRGQFSEAAPFNDIIIAFAAGSPVRLSDVGEAIDHVESERQLARFTRQTSVGMGIVKQADANTVELARSVRARMAELSENFPPGIQYHIASDTSVYVEENIRDLQLTILFATILVVLTVMAFLRSGRGTIIVALAIPTSLLIGLAVINVLGFTINVLTMLALILVIGIVIDDAIVVLERAFTHMENGAEARPAARIGTTEVAFPAIANTLSLAAVFIPVAFAGGLIGRFFFEFGLTVASTVFASTFVALTLTPMLCSRLLRERRSDGTTGRRHEAADEAVGSSRKPQAESRKPSRPILRAYMWLLDRALRFRAVTVLIGVAAFGLGMLALVNVPREFAQMEDRSRVMIIFETPRGSSMDRTDALAREIERVLAETPEISHQFLAIGLARTGPGDVNRGMSFVTLVPRDEREAHQRDVMQHLRQRFDELPGGRVFVAEMTPGGAQFGGDPIEVVIQHPDLQELAVQQERVMNWMRSRPDLYVGVRSDLELNNPQVDVHINRDLAAEMNVSVSDISHAMRFLLAEPEISRIERDAQRYLVVTDLIGRGQLTPEILRHLYLRSGNGDLVSMDHLVDIQETIGPSQINRFNRMRSATVSSQIPPGVALGDAVEVLEAHLRDELPPGAQYELAGQSLLFEESFYYLSITIVFSVIFIYLVLAAQFESFVYPLIIMTALPLATVGAFGSLWLFGMSLSIFAFIGLIMLLGLVTKNAILLIDYTNVLVRRGMPARQAAREAAMTRFRPVLMTATSTVLGMMPIALGFGAGGEVRMPLGISVAAGLATSTLLTLVIVPVVYTLFAQLQEWILRTAGAESDRIEAAGAAA